MQFTKLVTEDGRLNYKNASNAQMCILGLHLTDDVGCHHMAYIKTSVEKSLYGGVGNITGIDVTDETVTLYDPFIEEDEEGTEIVISKKKFLYILDEWEKVCKERPREVTIIREGDTFRFEKMF